MSALPTEHNEQATFFDWLNLKLNEYPEIHPLFFAVPNGANLAGNTRQKAIQMNKLKREGFVPGVSDTVYLSGRGGYLGLVLEFKTEQRRNQKDGGLSENQQEFLRAARMEGYLAAVAYGVEDGIDIVSNYLSMPKTQDMVYQALRMAEHGDLDGCKKTLQSITMVW